jgi:lipid-binding SYLF domain-containing protein
LEFDWIRRRHHCRLCGGVFSDDVCQKRSLLPFDIICVAPDATSDSFNPRDPQRLCDFCYEVVQPIQEFLADKNSNCQQEHMVDEDSFARYFNMPLSFSLEEEVKKAAYTIANFTTEGIIKDKSIPLPLLQAAKGLAFLSVIKVGLIYSCKLGTGLVVSRSRDGSWSAPSAIGTAGMGWGAQVGAEMTDFVILLNSHAAVDAFAGQQSLTLGGALGVAVGPLGRSGGAQVQGGDAGMCACYTYSHSKGLFAGISLEGSVIQCRTEVNKDFYGKHIEAAELLSGNLPCPPAAQPLYDALNKALDSPGQIAYSVPSGFGASGASSIPIGQPAYGRSGSGSSTGSNTSGFQKTYDNAVAGVATQMAKAAITAQMAGAMGGGGGGGSPQQQQQQYQQPPPQQQQQYQQPPQQQQQQYQQPPQQQQQQQQPPGPYYGNIAPAGGHYGGAGISSPTSPQAAAPSGGHYGGAPVPQQQYQQPSAAPPQPQAPQAPPGPINLAEQGFNPLVHGYRGQQPPPQQQANPFG